jgi:uncharacterized OB-fold protein
MTPQEAIDVLKKNYPSERFEDLREAVDEAIAALEKQVPKPAKRKNRTIIEYCASCGRVLDSDDYFCWWCGQRIER